MVLVAACQSDVLAEPTSAETPEAGGGVVYSTEPLPAPVASGSELNPVIVSTVAGAGNQSAFVLPTVRPTATATPDVPPPVEQEVGDTATPLPTDTPQPTFTPPALPFTSEDEHYWFRRPAPDGSVVWTDKAYPYGGTRGGRLRPHHGVEFNVPYNTPIYASASGTVVTAGSDEELLLGETTNFYGKVVVIEHDSHWKGQAVFTLYGHLNEVYVAEGQRVDALQLIGLSGATGVADGPHLHFEVRVGSNDYASTRNPLLWIYPFEERGTVAGQVTWPDGSLAGGVPVTLRRVDAATAQYYETTTYTGNTVNGDDDLGENFVIDDVVAGYYEVTVSVGENRVKQEL